MEMKRVIICSVVGLLGILSAVMGFAAEGKRTKASQIYVDTDSLTCVYPHSPSLGLGFAAAAAILIAQIIISIATGCFCCSRGSCQSKCKWITGLICIIMAWITCIIALGLLLAASVEAGQHKTMISIDGSMEYVDCAYYKSGIFAGGAVMSLITLILQIVGYLAWDSAKTPRGGGTSGAPNEGGMPMGRPQFATTQYPPAASAEHK